MTESGFIAIISIDDVWPYIWLFNWTFECRKWISSFSVNIIFNRCRCWEMLLSWCESMNWFSFELVQMHLRWFCFRMTILENAMSRVYLLVILTLSPLYLVIHDNPPVLSYHIICLWFRYMICVSYLLSHQFIWNAYCLL